MLNPNVFNPSLLAPQNYPLYQWSQTSYPPVQQPASLNPCVAGFYPLVAAEIANSITANRDQNLLRVLLFNLCSGEDWRGQATYDLMDMASKFMLVKFVDSNGGDLRYAINEIAETAIALYSTLLFFRDFNNSLPSYLPANLQNACQVNLRNLNEVGAKFDAYILRMQGGAGMNRQQPQAYYGNNQQPQGNGYWGYNRSTYSGGPQTILPGNSAGPITRGTYERFESQPVDRVDVINGTTEPPIQSRYADPPAPANNQEPAMAEVNQNLEWLPFPEQPHRSLLDTRFYRSILSKSGDKVWEKVDIIPGEENMDRNAHITMSAGGYPFNPKRETGLGSQVSELADLKAEDIVTASEMMGKPELEQDLLEAINDINVVVGLRTMAATNVYAAIDDGRTEQVTHSVQGPNSVYRIFSKIFRPIYTDKKNQEYLTKLKNAVSLSSLGMILDRASEKAKVQNDEGLALFVETINNYLTDIVNDLIANKLGFSTISIDSFQEDLADLLKFIEEKGPVYEAGFSRFEEDLMKVIFNPAEESWTDELLDQMFYEPEQKKPDVVFLTEGVCITYIGLTYRELNLNLKAEEALLIRDSITPELWKIADSAFEQNKAFPPVREYYLITRDDKVLKFHKSYVGLNNENRYLISLA